MSTRPITDTLRLINGGSFIDEISVDMNKLVRAIDENGGTGKLVIELSVKKSAGGAVAVSAKHALKTPAVKPDETLLWPTVEGNLVIDNPHQRKLDLKVVDEAPRPELKTAT